MRSGISRYKINPLEKLLMIRGSTMALGFAVCGPVV